MSLDSRSSIEYPPDPLRAVSARLNQSDSDDVAIPEDQSGMTEGRLSLDFALFPLSEISPPPPSEALTNRTRARARASQRQRCYSRLLAGIIRASRGVSPARVSRNVTGERNGSILATGRVALRYLCFMLK